MKLTALRENHLYSKAYQRGKKFAAHNIVVYVMPDFAAARLARANPTHKRVNRIGLTVTKKLGGAVVRNRAKRVMREGYRLLDSETHIKRGLIIVMVARSGIIRAKSTDIKNDLKAAFSKLGLI